MVCASLLRTLKYLFFTVIFVSTFHSSIGKTIHRFKATKKPCTKHIFHGEVVLTKLKETLQTTKQKPSPKITSASLPSKTKTPCTKTHTKATDGTTSSTPTTKKVEVTVNQKTDEIVMTPATTQTITCKKVDCILGEWSPWSHCSSSCGNTGVTERYRKVKSPPLCGGICSFPLQQKKHCNRLCLNEGLLTNRGCQCRSGYSGVCCEKVNGNWSPWGPWSMCTKTCDGGIQRRIRNCSQPSPANGGDDCPGTNQETVECNVNNCPVNGGWGVWGAWSPCTASCGEGTKFRQRQCNNPYPSNGGLICIGLMVLTAKCQLEPCKVPVDGGWSSWLEWSPCSKTCGFGSRMRVRVCNNPLPSDGGRNCPGSSQEEEKCYTQPCKIPGNGGAGAEGGIGKRYPELDVILDQKRHIPGDAKRHAMQAKRSNLAQSPIRHAVQKKRGRTTSYVKRDLVKDIRSHAKRYMKTSDHTAPVVLQQTHANSNAKRFSKRGRAPQRRLLSYAREDLVENFDVQVQKYYEELFRNDDQSDTSGPWTSWSTCSTTCGEGQRFRTRACNDLANPCNGTPMDIQQCSMSECPN